ncbi:origin recognition complex subunit 1 [Cydia splendana]|uniref:origin recognition complex subunit 1 n=1 Tax=Cydia splendana TaxID=1100963 RepID=UPI0028F4C68A
MPRKVVARAVTWLSDKQYNEQNISTNFHYYEKFQFQKLIAGIDDFVLISNADSAEPDTEEGCDAARIVALYEDVSNSTDPFRAKVQWYSRPSDLPKSSINNVEPIEFVDKEVLEDHRPFSTDVSIETFFKKCQITFAHTKDIHNVLTSANYHYVCRYRIMPVNKRKVQIEPVLEEERLAMQYLQTPSKNTPTKGRTPKTPSSLVKRMSRVSISEPKNWSVSKNDGTKLLLKRAILADKTEKDSPKKATPKSKNITPADTPRSSKKLSNNNIEELLSMELKENAEGGLPTLIIRQHVLGTPKRKSSISKTKEDTPKKVLLFDDDDDEKESHSRRRKSPVCYDEDMSPNKPTPTKVTRSGRVTKSTINYAEPDSSPIKRTPRKSIRRATEDSDDDFKPILMTPKTPKTPKTPRTPRARATPAKTPKSVTRRILTSQLTPTLHTRAHSFDNIDEILKENNSLPGRESQMEEILSFVRSKLLSETSGCMYISGVPGTGKTATVCSSLKLLQDETDLPQFQLVEVNGMRIAEPRQAYVQIYKQLTGKSVVWEQACSLLEKRFNNPGPRRTPTVLLVDELDALCTRRQDVLYSIMEWAAHDAARLCVLCVANTMDLPERALAARVASRLGLTRLTFPPYTHAQLSRIVAARLASASLSADAVQLIARKVAAVSGDARRALALCSRALELGSGSAGAAAGLREVAAALEEAASGAAVRAIRACAPAERLMLRAVAAEVERTGSDETTLSLALTTAAALVSLEGRPYRAAYGVRPPSAAQAAAACARLAALRLLLLENKGPEPRLLLNVSADDVHYATRQITV